MDRSSRNLLPTNDQTHDKKGPLILHFEFEMPRLQL